MKICLPKKRILKGFTLIELLVVIAVISTLAVVVFVALNPAQRLDDANNARRSTDVDSILTAIHSAIVDNKGDLPTNMPAAGTEAQLGTGASGCTTYGAGAVACGTQAACVDLMADVDVDLIPYLKNMPVDPKEGTASQSGYTVLVDTNGIVTVRACGAEGTTISSSR